jgi:hypothetical protein
MHISVEWQHLSIFVATARANTWYVDHYSAKKQRLSLFSNNFQNTAEQSAAITTGLSFM